MTQIWQQLSPRERLLIIVASALLAILVLTLLVIRPVVGMRNDARAAFEDATQTHILVARAAMVPSSSAPREASALRTIITNSASQNGIVINRISTDQSVISISLNEVEPARLFDWLAQLERQEQIVVSDASIRPTADGSRVSATFGMRSEGR